MLWHPYKRFPATIDWNKLMLVAIIGEANILHVALTESALEISDLGPGLSVLLAGLLPVCKSC